MTGIDHFQTAVRGIAGEWPTAPGLWSYSSLGNAEDCPRRWMLSRADYGELWGGHGYPPRPALPALTGSVVHRCLELLLSAFQAQGSASVADPSAVEVATFGSDAPLQSCCSRGTTCDIGVRKCTAVEAWVVHIMDA